MASMNVSLTGEMQRWVHEQAMSEHHGDESAYLQALIQHDQDRSARIAMMQRLVDEALASEDSRKSLAEIRDLGRHKADLPSAE